MNPLPRAATLLASLLLMALVVGPASAAKGVKKNGQYIAQGTVSTLHRHKNGQTLTILTQHPRRRKSGQSTGGTRALPETFAVDGRTRITGGTLQQGQRVTVNASGQHADSVVIAHSTRKTRQRTPTHHRRLTHHTSPRTTVHANPVTHVNNTNTTVNHARPATPHHATPPRPAAPRANPPRPHVAAPHPPAHRPAAAPKKKR